MVERAIRLYGCAILMVLMIQTSRALYCNPGTGFRNRYSGGICVPCKAGLYSLGGEQSQNSENSCTPCEGGTYQPKSGSTGCISCPAGTVSGPRAQNCRGCGWGTYQDQEGQNICKHCGFGNFTRRPGTGRTECDICPQGTSTVGIGSHTCLQVCAPGTRGRNGLAPCRPCYHGRYAATKRSRQCTSCSEGKSTVNSGSTSPEQCNVCAAGYRGKKKYGRYAGRPPCVICPAGTKSPRKSKFCIRCPRGTTTKSSGTPNYGSCVCTPGSSSDFGFPPCTTCAKGTYQRLAGGSGCNRCPAGTTTRRAGSTDRDKCYRPSSG